MEPSPAEILQPIVMSTAKTPATAADRRHFDALHGLPNAPPGDGNAMLLQVI